LSRGFRDGPFLTKTAKIPIELRLPEERLCGKLSFMKYTQKNSDDTLIQEFLNKGGKISIGKTKPMPAELGISKNVWNNKLTKEEKLARDKK
jgi:hypothetical protein